MFEYVCYQVFRKGNICAPPCQTCRPWVFNSDQPRLLKRYYFCSAVKLASSGFPNGTSGTPRGWVRLGSQEDPRGFTGRVFCSIRFVMFARPRTSQNLRNSRAGGGVQLGSHEDPRGFTGRLFCSIIFVMFACPRTSWNLRNSAGGAAWITRRPKRFYRTDAISAA